MKTSYGLRWQEGIARARTADNCRWARMRAPVFPEFQLGLDSEDDKVDLNVHAGVLKSKDGSARRVKDESQQIKVLLSTEKEAVSWTECKCPKMPSSFFELES